MNWIKYIPCVGLIFAKPVSAKQHKINELLGEQEKIKEEMTKNHLKYLKLSSDLAGLVEQIKYLEQKEL